MNDFVSKDGSQLLCIPPDITAIVVTTCQDTILYLQSELTVFNKECSLTKERQSYQQGDILSVLWLTCSLTKAEVLNSPQRNVRMKSK